MHFRKQRETEAFKEKHFLKLLVLIRIGPYFGVLFTYLTDLTHTHTHLLYNKVRCYKAQPDITDITVSTVERFRQLYEPSTAYKDMLLLYSTISHLSLIRHCREIQVQQGF